MIPISVCNHKGGTGKTTSTLMIAAALGLSGRKVLIVDLDPQGFLTRMTGLSEPAPEFSSLALFGSDAAVPAQAYREFPAFSVLPASARLSAQMRRLTKATDVLWAKEAAEASFGAYDVVLYDTAAAVTVYTLNALVASSFVVIPVLPEYQPVLGAEQTFRTAKTVAAKLNPGLTDPFFLLTMVDARKRNHHAYRKYLRERYEGRVLDAIVRTSASLSVTRQDGKTVFDTDPYGRGAVDYALVVDELERRMPIPRPPADA